MNDSKFFVNWNDMPGREVFPGVNLVWPCTGDQLQVTRSVLTAGCDLPYHAHPQEQIIVLLEGTLDYTVGDETRRIGPGNVIRIPPSSWHGGRVVGEGRAV